MSIYLTVSLIFLRVGLFSFGGGMAMLPLIFQSVQQFGVMSSEEFANLVALSQVTPGPVAVNAATYVGLYSAGILGAIIGTICVCLPSFVVVIIVIRILDRFKDNRYVEGAFTGIRPAAIGLIAAAGVFIAQGVLIKGTMVSTEMLHLDYYNLIPMGIFAASIILMIFTKIKPVLIMLLMGLVGLVIYGFII